MEKSQTIYGFELSQHEGYTCLNAQEYPWSVLQVVPCTPENFDKVVEACCKNGSVAKHDTDRSFVIIHSCSGDQGGRYPERHICIDDKRRPDAFLMP